MPCVNVTVSTVTFTQGLRLTNANPNDATNYCQLFYCVAMPEELIKYPQRTPSNSLL
jgi:hypothetical protein